MGLLVLSRSLMRGLGLAFHFASAFVVDAALTVAQLGYENRMDPLGVGVVYPPLSWILQSAQRGDLWFSGKPVSDGTWQPQCNRDQPRRRRRKM
jgi:hypothetical protein